MLPPAVGSIRSRRALPPSAVMQRVGAAARHARRTWRASPPLRRAARRARPVLPPSISAARAYSLSVGTPSISTSSESLGQRRVRHGIAHEHIGRAVHALFERAVPGFADAGRVQRPTPGAAVRTRRRHNPRARRRRAARCAAASAASGGNVAGSWKIQRFGTRDADGLAAAIAGGIERAFDLAACSRRRPTAGPPVSTTSSTGRSLGQTVRPAATMSRSSAAAIEHHRDRAAGARGPRAEHVGLRLREHLRPAPGRWRRRARRWRAPAPRAARPGPAPPDRSAKRRWPRTSAPGAWPRRAWRMQATRPR